MNYPYDIVTLFHKETFSVEAHFSQEKKESPMKVFDGAFSRFTGTIIKNKKVAFFNIPIEMLPGMRARTDIAAKEQYTPKSVQPDESASSPAFTTKFFAGSLKGKSPAEIIMADPIGGKETLNAQYKWLKENKQKNPNYAENNQKLMDAIVATSKLDLSKLSKESVVSSNITVLDIGCRPLTRRTREDGKCLVYEGKVEWDTSRRYPVQVTIKNYYADVKKNDDGTLNVNLSSKDSSTEIINTGNLTADEWLYTLHEMESARNCFKMCHFNEGYNLAEKAAAEARNAAKHS